ncbi:deubiquitinase otu-like isoform X2 [Dermacentor variabilis]|uniref:deubiquitinase otu-like isoform X2 n=1 Tax=Dermacentor variabilis TaxID=34621 RepID=UPI003F5B07F6
MCGRTQGQARRVAANTKFERALVVLSLSFVLPLVQTDRASQGIRMTSLCTMLYQEEGNRKMDAYLNSLGFWRKQIAADGSCLFRVVSEHVYSTQTKHEAVRRACVQHLRENKSTYAKYLDGDFENYLLNMENVKVWGGHLEMHAMATLYKKDFLIFDSPSKSPYYATENRFTSVVMLCYIRGNHYDAVYSKQELDAAAFCQSILYKILYENVFEMGDDVDLAVQKMLHDKKSFKHRKHMNFEQWKECVKFGIETNVLPEEEQATASEVATALANRIAPFPFKVAKALDPTIYRNVEYDNWKEAEKEKMRSEQLVIPDLKPGVKCVVQMSNDFEGHSTSFQAHVQNVEPDEGLVTVFVERMGKLCTVPYDKVQALPLPAHKVLTSCEGPVPHQLQGCLYQQTLLPSVQDLPESQCRLARKGKAKDLSLWLPTAVTGAHPPLDFSLPQPSNVSCSPPDDQVRFPLSPSSPIDTSESVWTHPVRMLAPGSPCAFPQPIMYQEKQRFQSPAAFDFTPQTCMPPSCSQSTAQDMPRENDDSSVVSPGNQTQLPRAHRAETPYSGNFTPSVFDQRILGQPPHTERGFLSAPLPSSYDYVSAPSFTYAAPYPDMMCSPPPCITPDARANDTPMPYGQEVPIVQHPQQQQFVTSYFPGPFANGVFSYEPPAPTVNLAAQRSNDPEGRDLPRDLATRRFFYNIGHDYFWTFGTTLQPQPFVFQSTQGYNSNFNMTHVPYVVDSSRVMPDVRCSTSGSAASTNSFTGGDGSPSSS